MSESFPHNSALHIIGDAASLLLPVDGKASVQAKFVVVRNGGAPTVIAGRYPDYSYHADILESWCNLHSIPCGRDGEDAKVEIFDRAWKIDGGGWFEVKPSIRLLRLFGHSTAYGGFSKNEIIAIVKSSELFSLFTIT